jgi:zinc finger-containing ubiquitin peptidase 1
MSSNDQPSTSSAQASAIHSCEICGQDGLSDDKMLQHTQKCHIEGNAQCPFCGINGTSSAELLLHVNQAHLDYLTPENELMLMSFIDDSKSPSGDGDDDSDSMSCGDGLSPSITEIAGIDSNDRLCNGSMNKNLVNENNKTSIKSKCNGSNQMDDNNNTNGNNCDMGNGTNSNHNGVQSHGEGSPLRSQLGLNLKANKPKITIPSPLTCLLCPYTTKEASVLEEHINRSHFDPISPGLNSQSLGGGGAHGVSSNHYSDTLDAFSCPICVRCFESGKDLEIHVNNEHTDILSPAKVESSATENIASTSTSTITLTADDESACNFCPVCGISFVDMKTQEMELHIDGHFAKSPVSSTTGGASPDLEKEARKVQEQREFEMLRAQYGMDDQGNFREQSAVAMQRAVYAGDRS